MRLSQRERVLIGTAIAVVGVFAIFFVMVRWGGSSSIRPDDRSLAQLRAEVSEKSRLDKKLRELEKTMSVRIPAEDTAGQVQNFIAAMEMKAGEAGMALTGMTPDAVSPNQVARKRREGSKVSFDLKIGGPHRGIVGFIEGLKANGLPFEVESFDVKANPQQPDALEGTMRLSFYLLDPMDLHAEEKKDEPKA